MIFIKVRPQGGTAQDQVAGFIARSGNNGGNSLLGHGKEAVRAGGGNNGVYSDLQAAAGAILESHRHGKPGSQFTVYLAFRGARADGAPRDQVRNVLRRDGVQELGSCGHSHIPQAQQQPAGHMETAVDVKGMVHERVVDEALPAHGGAGLFKIHAHDDHQILFKARHLFLQAGGIVHGSLGIMDGARPHHHQQAVVVAGNDVLRILAGRSHHFGDFGGCRIILD